jgi:hypothetical protein
MLLVLLIIDQSQELCTGNGLRLAKQADAVPSIGMISAHVYEAAMYPIRCTLFRNATTRIRRSFAVHRTRAARIRPDTNASSHSNAIATDHSNKIHVYIAQIPVGIIVHLNQKRQTQMPL